MANKGCCQLICCGKFPWEKDDWSVRYGNANDPWWTWSMVVQGLLCLYYLVSVSLRLGSFSHYYYYEWDPESDDYEVLDVLVYSDEESFECSNRTFFRECTGPFYTDSVKASKCQDDEMGQMEAALVYLIVFALFIAGVVCFVIDRLKSRYHGQLMGLVTFKEKNKTMPVKFAVPFTLICNVKDGAMSGIFGPTDLCGRPGRNPDEDEDGPGYIIALFGLLVMMFGVAFLVWWPFRQVFRYCCGCCVNEPEEIHGWRRGAFMWIRRLVIGMAVASIIGRILSWETLLEIDYDLDEFPNWAVASLISTADALVSLAVDIYLTYNRYIAPPSEHTTTEEPVVEV